MHDLIDRGDPRFARLGTVGQAAEALTKFEALIRTSMWNMQRHWTLHNLRDQHGLNANLRRKGVELRLVLPGRVAEHRCPLASSHMRYLRLAPVAHPMLIGDQRRILVGDSTGEAIWTTAAPEIVAGAVAHYERVWHSAAPAVPEGQDPPFTRRMVDIAFRLVDGASDREIARDLRVSERTVSSDVQELCRRLGARSRANAIAIISGLPA